MDRRTKILAGVLGLAVLFGIFSQVIYPDYIRPWLTLDERIAREEETLAKLQALDPLTSEPVTVLWVKGSGGDLGSMKRDGFATLYLDKLERLKAFYRGIEHEDEMVGYLPHCTFGLNQRAASIDTPLHAYLPYRHVDHVHPDAVIAIAASARSEELTREIYGDEVRFKLVAPSTSWFRRKRSVFAESGGFDFGLVPGGLAADLISAIEARALWSRFGL